MHHFAKGARNTMTEEELYNYSKSIRLLDKTIKSLQSSHVYRYSRLVDSSSRGLECTYAKMVKKMLPEEHTKFLETLEQIERLTSLFKEKYIEEYMNEEKKSNS